MNEYNFAPPDDRGHARYFHGRKRILASFSLLLRRAIDEKLEGNGTIVLVQGAPGAGKTALLYKCSELAQAGSNAIGGQKWNVIDIEDDALYSPVSLMDQAEAAYEIGKTTENSLEVKPKAFGAELAGYARTPRVTRSLTPGCENAWRN